LLVVFEGVRAIQESHAAVAVFHVPAGPIGAFGIDDRPDATVIDREGPRMLALHNYLPASAVMVYRGHAALTVAHDQNLLSVWKKAQASDLTPIAGLGACRFQETTVGSAQNGGLSEREIGL
jgi:hypothetical protein